MNTYAVGDVHGCLGKLERLVERCLKDNGHKPANFIFLGDYIDRGPDSRGVVQFLLEFQSTMPKGVICLTGNHEELALAALHGGAATNLWLRNGGAETLRSYGITEAADLPPHHIAWLESLPTHHDDGRRLFVHAGINPDRPLNQQDPYDLVWIREPFLTDERDFGRLIVHGHTPVRTGRPDQRPHRLNIDTGAVLGGPLTAAVFDDQQTLPHRFIQAG